MNNYPRYPGDDLKSKDPRLKRKWEWCRSASQISDEDLKKWTHFQTSQCVEDMFVLEAVQWKNHKDGVEYAEYEAIVSWDGTILAAEHEIGTRIEAQIAAERLVKEWFEEQYIKLFGATSFVSV
jgi:hypothetical protein